MVCAKARRVISKSCGEPVEPINITYTCQCKHYNKLKRKHDNRLVPKCKHFIKRLSYILEHEVVHDVNDIFVKDRDEDYASDYYANDSDYSSDKTKKKKKVIML